MDKKEKIEKLKYICMELRSGNYTVLSDSISIGPVYKIHFRGSLDEDLFEKGFLYIPKGSGIKIHKHVNDIELYRLISGSLSVMGKEDDSNMCFIGEEHNIDVVDRDTFIETFKLNKKYLDKIGFESDNDKEETFVKTYKRLENEISL